ncbi:MAG: hypothetical protein RIC55_28610 [Pirellulaceae bacterium]
MPGNALHVGDRQIQATANIDIASHGARTSLMAAGEEGALVMSANKIAALVCGSTALSMENDEDQAGAVSLQAGPEGQLTIALGPEEIGPRIVLEPELLTIAVGVPGVGASIKMTPESIMLQVAENTVELTPEGLTEIIAEVMRSLTAEGQTVTAGETVHTVGLTGEEMEGPTNMAEAEGDASIMAPMLEVTGDGMLTEEGAMVMIN